MNFLLFHSFDRFPFDSNTPIGYLITFVLEYITLGYTYFIVECSLALLIGSYWFAIAIIKEMRRILHSINGMAQAKEVRSHELMASFLEFIDAYAIIKELSVFEYFENGNDR